MFEIYILSGVVVFLGAINLYERWQAGKREKDLLNRLMARSMDEYTANSVRLSTTKPEYIGEITDPEDEYYPVD